MCKRCACVFLGVAPGERDLPRPVFRSKDQRGAGADYHARPGKGKFRKHANPVEDLTEIIALCASSMTRPGHRCTDTQKQTQRRMQPRVLQHAQMPGACYSSGLSKRGTKSMQSPRGVFPSRTPSQFSTKAYRNSAHYAITVLPSRLQHRIMGSPGKDKQSMIALPHS